MKITDITLLHTGQQFLVRVRTDAGIAGLGECSNMNAAVIAAHLKGSLIPLAMGQDPRDIERLVETLFLKTYKLAGQSNAIAISGLEMACWDILGQALGVPIYRLLGGAYRRKIPLYASSMRRDTSPEQEADRLAAVVERHGFTGVKIKIGGRQSFDQDATPGRSLALVREVRRRLGEGVAILVDANSSYSAPRAIEMGRRLEDLGIFHYEEPCPYADLEAHAKVAAALDVPVALGEQEWELRRFRQMLEHGAADIVQPDVIKCGGYLQVKKIATLAEAFGAVCTPHMTSMFGLIANLHLAASTPAMRYAQEYNIEAETDAPPGGPLARLWRDPPRICEGCLEVPEGPGLGLALREEVLAQARVL